MNGADATIVTTAAVAVVTSAGGWLAWWTGRRVTNEQAEGLHVDTADQVVAMVRGQLAELAAENVRLREQMVADAIACEDRASALAAKVDHLTKEVGALRLQVRHLGGDETASPMNPTKEGKK